MAATGTVTFANWNTGTSVTVPKGTSVSVQGTIAFTTNDRVVVAQATFDGTNTMPSHASVAITAVVPGLTGNVDGGAIDTIDDRSIRRLLRVRRTTRIGS